MGTVSTGPETLSNNKQQRVIQELIHGQECATQLQILFHKSSEEGGLLSAGELLQQILRSFNETIFVLSGSAADMVSQNQAASNSDSPCCDDPRSEDSSESRKRSSPVASNDKRGCYKRKRGAQTWTVTSSTMEDGHAWRKYGQKDILNSKHPRSYFRCTRKYDQGCRATRHVQRTEDDARMYQITYIGTHTCRDSFRAPQIIPDSESYKVMTCGESKLQSKHNHLNPSTTSPRVIKQETQEEATPSDLTDLDNSMNMWKDIMGDGFEYSSGINGSDYGDVVISTVYSCTEISSRNFELDLVIKPVEFDGDFDFDETEFV
ncbi:hypothetical protein PTKIN_Ptkin16aG0002000 [Pterospermum kingtungense]